MSEPRPMFEGFPEFDARLRAPEPIEPFAMHLPIAGFNSLRFGVLNIETGVAERFACDKTQNDLPYVAFNNREKTALDLQKAYTIHTPPKELFVELSAEELLKIRATYTLPIVKVGLSRTALQCTVDYFMDERKISGNNVNPYVVRALGRQATKIKKIDNPYLDTTSGVDSPGDHPRFSERNIRFNSVHGGRLGGTSF